MCSGRTTQHALGYHLTLIVFVICLCMQTLYSPTDCQRVMYARRSTLGSRTHTNLPPPLRLSGNDTQIQANLRKLGFHRTPIVCTRTRLLIQPPHVSGYPLPSSALNASLSSYCALTSRLTFFRWPIGIHCSRPLCDTSILFRQPATTPLIDANKPCKAQRQMP